MGNLDEDRQSALGYQSALCDRHSASTRVANIFNSMIGSGRRTRGTQISLVSAFQILPVAWGDERLAAASRPGRRGRVVTLGWPCRVGASAAQHHRFVRRRASANDRCGWQLDHLRRRTLQLVAPAASAAPPVRLEPSRRNALLIAYVVNIVTNCGTLFGLRLLATVPRWLVPPAIRSGAVEGALPDRLTPGASDRAGVSESGAVGPIGAV
jgi:hypothetical protein